MAIKAVYPKKTVHKKTKKRVGKPSHNPKRVVKSSHKKVKKRRAGLLSGILSKPAGEMDYTFLLIVGVLTVFGLIMLLSASTPTADVKFGRSYHFFIRQFAFAVFGAVLMLVLSRIDYRKFKPYAKLFLLICVALLILVLIPHVGVSHNGSRRWLNLGAFEFQPSELTKCAISMYLAAEIEKGKYELKKFRDMIRLGLWIIVIAGLMMLETHVSGTIVLCGIALCVMIAGGANMKIIGGGAISGGVLGVGVLSMLPGRWARLMNFLGDPLKGDHQSTGYQVVQSLYAIGSGGIFGKGLGQSVQKFSYLPEPYNDFIFAIVCEELGLVGAAFIIVLFAGLIVRGLKIALEAPDTFGSLMVVGIISQVALQTVLNIAVVTSTIPNTGVPLPFFSYGGTAIMILLAEMGIVLSVSRYSVKKDQ